MGLQSGMNHGGDIFNAAERHAFFRRQLQLPANALLGEERGPAALPAVGLHKRCQFIIKIQTELQLLTPLMQRGQLLA
ncbi:hypothetical protein D3C80_1564720 [compost metagenome]